ncbi:hypothetical protein GCM10012284_37970 [Mangrovihabitans endophyticus]|uniref:Uncharacterized protein n=1 Tax=Mangrovihabitans endophyticus TaxID=1751298 RepID=A0A8J3C073_9ACTN|nr:hypothetical protein GCM10012284_37970 [Mangrovihabitans endophyticus]
MQADGRVGRSCRYQDGRGDGEQGGADRGESLSHDCLHKGTAAEPGNSPGSGVRAAAPGGPTAMPGAAGGAQPVA